jgi:glycosyltransferase involved in cell wall biosynthesis
VRAVPEQADLTPYLWGADVGLNPITTGAGSNVKLPTYLAAGLDVVSTPFGLRGFDRLAPYVTASAVDAFADALSQPPAPRAGRIEALAGYAWSAQSDRLFEAYAARRAGQAVPRVRVLMAHKFYYQKAGAEAYVFRLTRLLEDAGHTVIPFAMQHPANLPSPYAKHFVSQVEFRGRRNVFTDIGRAARVIWSTEAEAKLDQAPARGEDRRRAPAQHRAPALAVDPRAARSPPRPHRPDDARLQAALPGLHVPLAGRGVRALQARPLLERGGATLQRRLAAAVADQRGRGGRPSRAPQLPHGDVFHCPALFEMAKMLEHGVPRERLAFVPHFVDATAYAPTFGGGDTRCSRAGLSEEKGLFTLLEAHRRTPGFELVIAGDGPLRAALEARVDPDQRRG